MSSSLVVIDTHWNKGSDESNKNAGFGIIEKFEPIFE